MTSHLPISPRMRLTDTNGVRLARGVDTQSVWRMADGMWWVWDIGVRRGRRWARKRELRYLVDEIVDPSGSGVVMQSPAQIVERLLGTERQQWSVTDVSNLLLCSKEHVHALLRSGALWAVGRRSPLQIGRASLAEFLMSRLLNQ